MYFDEFKDEELAENFLCCYCGKDLGTYTPICCPNCTSSQYTQYKDFIDPEMEWGTYGKNGDEPLKHNKLKDCDTEHLIAIVKTQSKISARYRTTIEFLIHHREVDKLLSIDTDDLPLYVNYEWYTELAQKTFKKRLSTGDKPCLNTKLQ